MDSAKSRDQIAAKYLIRPGAVQLYRELLPEMPSDSINRGSHPGASDEECGQPESGKAASGNRRLFGAFAVAARQNRQRNGGRMVSRSDGRKPEAGVGTAERSDPAALRVPTRSSSRGSDTRHAGH